MKAKENLKTLKPKSLQGLGNQSNDWFRFGRGIEGCITNISTINLAHNGNKEIYVDRHIEYNK